ncbi:MAG TPA: TetR/AcrR family transcriptional regulator [Microbacteriaceae bacterium]
MANSATDARKRRGPIARLDRDMIIDAALTIAARPGTTSISIRDLGSFLKADPTAIYRHVESKDGLVRLLLDRLTGIALGRNTASPNDWKEYLRESARITLGVFTEYPSIGAEAVRLSSDGSHELDVIEDILAAFAAAGLNRSDRIRFYGIWSFYLISCCAGAARERMDSGENSMPSVWVDRNLNDAENTHPQVRQARAELLALTDISIYMSGVELILEATERAAAATA